MPRPSRPPPSQAPSVACRIQCGARSSPEGAQHTSPGQGPGWCVEGEHPYALASVLFDVLNRVAVDAVLGKADAYEVDLAVGHLAHTRPGDLLLMDRNYPSY